MIPFTFRYRTYLFILILSGLNLYGEGVRELRPDSVYSSADLYFDNYIYSDYPPFGIINCLPNYRLNIHIKNAGESILFGMWFPLSNIQYNLRKPDGTIVKSGICPWASGQQGFIRYYNQAIKGPFPNLGGYIPLEHKVTSTADTGDYYFELVNLPTFQDARVSLWDFQVVSGAHTPATPSDTINGRVWSQSWQINAELMFYRLFNGRFYIYSDDGIVTRLSFDDARIGVFDVFCNPYGCLNTGNFLTDRQSRNSNTFTVFPGIAQYKVFLNNPDSTVYPSGTYGSIIGIPYMISDPLYPPCSGNKLIVIEVNKPGSVEVLITLPYGAPATNVFLFSSVVTGINYIPWDGKDGLGNPVPDNTLVTVSITYINGLTNLPIWDQEQNVNGYRIALVRPPNSSTPNPLTYWDDTQIPAGSGCPTGYNLTGCLPAISGCHTWSGADCHNKTINSWWYGGTCLASFSTLYFTTPPSPIGHGASRCGPGSVTLHATVPPGETVDLYDTITGGIPLLMGDTTFITPLLYSSKTYYAEARNDSSQCLSATRTPVDATILPVPVPSLTGPDLVCLNIANVIYTTDTGQSNYQWSVSPGGVITSGSGTYSITVTWNSAGPQWVNVSYTNIAGCAPVTPSVIKVQVVPPPGPAGPIHGPESVCAGSEHILYWIAPVPFASSCIWTLPVGMVITSGDGTDSVYVDISENAASGYLSVYGANLCGNGAPSPPLWIDIQPKPMADAGPDSTVCQQAVVTLTGASALYYKSIHWLSSGLGIMMDDTTLTPTYYPAEGETGQIQLTLIAEGESNCPSDTSSMILNIVPIAWVNAGTDKVTCTSTPVLLSDASGGQIQNIHWFSSGTGVFNDTSILHPTYIPGQEDIEAGRVTLYISVYSFTPCPAIIDSLKLTIAWQASANAGPDTTICGNDPLLLVGASATNAMMVNWSTLGSGHFSNPGTIQPMYFPSQQDLSAGQVILILTAISQSPCSPNSDSLVITLKTGPDAEAGPNGTTCTGMDYPIQGAYAMNYSELLWTHNGSGTLIEEHTINPVYRPGPGETGIISLILHVYGIGICSSTTSADTTSLIIYLDVSTDAGPDQMIPYDSSAYLSGSSSGGSGNFNWYWEPASLLSNPFIPDPKTVPLTHTTYFYCLVTDLLTG